MMRQLRMQQVTGLLHEVLERENEREMGVGVCQKGIVSELLVRSCS